MANDHFMPQFAELVGSWGSLETNTGESALTAMSGSDKVRCEWDEGDLASDLNDDTPILYWSQLHTIVDSIVEEFVKNALPKLKRVSGLVESIPNPIHVRSTMMDD